MSTNYRFNENIPKDKFLEAVKKVGLKPHTPERDVDENSISITCGEYYLWFYVGSDNTISECCRYGANYDAETTILIPLSEYLDIGYLSEYNEGYFDDKGEEEEEEKENL